MSWLTWRDFIKPFGRYGRVQFLFWFFVPIICIVSFLVKIWEFEKLLIRLGFYSGVIGLNTRLLIQILTILLLLFLIYLIVIAMIKRCNDLDRSGWWILLMPVPIVGMLFLVYIMFWPGKASYYEAKKGVLLRVVAMSVAAAVVFALFTISSLFFEYFTLYEWMSSLGNKPTPLRIWNQTDEVLNITFITSDGIVHQQYPASEVKPNEIIKNEDILFLQGEYAVTAKNAIGKTVYSKDFTSKQLLEMHWIILIPQP